MYIHIKFRFRSQQEINIMSANIVKSVSRSLPLIAAALLVPAGAAFAAPSPTGDIQEQMRDLLAGKSANPPTALIERHADSTAADLQEQARRVLLGVTVGRADASRSENAATAVVLINDDTQIMAQHLLLGDRNTAAAGS
jgi:hypothetical protein